MDEQGTSTLEAVTLNNGDPPDEAWNGNGNDKNTKVLRRLDTVPDIKRDTSGITTQYIATGIGNSKGFE